MFSRDLFGVLQVDPNNASVESLENAAASVFTLISREPETTPDQAEQAASVVKNISKALSETKEVCSLTDLI